MIKGVLDPSGEERAAGESDREKLVQAFAAEGLRPDDFLSHGPLSDADAEALARAAHLFLARGSQMNLPGTTDQHPNWRRRFPVDVPSVLTAPRLVALAANLTEMRGNR